MHLLRRTAVAHTYQRACASFFANTFWRRKWPLLIAFISCVVLAATLISIAGETNTAKRDTYLDDVPRDLYREGERRIRRISYHETENLMAPLVVIYSIAQVVQPFRR